MNPGIAIHLTKRFSVPALESEVTRLVRSNPLACIDVPGALNLLVGDRLDSNVRRDLKVRSNLIYQRDILALISTSYCGPWSHRLPRYPSSNVDTAAIHSSCNMHTVHWNNTPLILHFSSFLKSFKPYDMMTLVRLSRISPPPPHSLLSKAKISLRRIRFQFHL